jgi:RNA polymerase sigma-70 factor (ECF subfamily)
MEPFMDDLEAIRRLKRRDMSGLEALVERYQVRAARVAFLITHNEAVAEDVVQATFLRMIDAIRHFDETRLFEPYFMRSVVNAALQAMRRDNQSVSLDDPDEVKALLDRAATVESQVEFKHLRGEILSAISKLPPKQRAVIVQRYYLGLSEAEMARALDTPPGTVKWLLNAARTRLRRLLGERNAK